jgi:outer membrane putative beta-barrel porin/alpha-amylase
VRTPPSGFAVEMQIPIAATLSAAPQVRFLSRVVAISLLFVMLFARLAAAQAGPPFIGDDPGTPGDGNWEINVATYTERHPTERLYNAPILDMNYGWGSRIQLKYQVPYLVDGSDGDPTRSGLGKSLAGVKWRFYDSDEKKLAISTYPQLEFNNPTSSLERGLVDYGTRFYLPFELTKKVGPFEINPEVGYWFAGSKGAAWATGLVVLREVNKRVELAGELYNTANTDGSNHWNTLDGGGRYKLGEHFVLLFMAGRSVTRSSISQPQFFGYLGMQFLFSMKHKTESPTETAP